MPCAKMGSKLSHVRLEGIGCGFIDGVEVIVKRTGKMASSTDKGNKF